MARRSNNSSCAFCENSNLASICASCVNHRLNEYNTSLKSMQNIRNSLYRKVEAKLEAKKKMDDQLNWRILQNEKIKKLKSRLHCMQKQLSEDKTKLAAASNDLKDKYESLEATFATISQNRVDLLEKFYQNLNCTHNLGHHPDLGNEALHFLDKEDIGEMAITSELLHKQSVIIKQICKLFPVRRVYSNGDKKDGSSALYDQICNARLPRGLDPHSVPSEELAASLGYMVQLLNLAIPSLAAPALHNSGFAGSCSRAWQRDSYWDARPSSQSKEYPLFIPRQKFCSSGGDTSWSDKSSSNFGITSVESERKPCLDASSSFNYSSASPHSVETHKDLQKGISLLKKSVACVTAYCYNYLCLDVPSEASTFEAFARLLAILSSSREMRSVLSLKMASSRSGAQAQRINKSMCNASSGVSSRSLEESNHMEIMPSDGDNIFSDSSVCFLYSGEMNDYDRKTESLVDGWDLVEHPALPPSTITD